MGAAGGFANCCRISVEGVEKHDCSALPGDGLKLGQSVCLRQADKNRILLPLMTEMLKVIEAEAGLPHAGICQDELVPPLSGVDHCAIHCGKYAFSDVDDRGDIELAGRIGLSAVRLYVSRDMALHPIDGELG